MEQLLTDGFCKEMEKKDFSSLDGVSLEYDEEFISANSEVVSQKFTYPNGTVAIEKLRTRKDESGDWKVLNPTE